ncbi:MAG: radical SAM/SPASM domain-containing protein [Endomicrobiaceae bacterium]|nr:radical SAM/SPASM domain-containing protein [Endomicrobiaceae bacterium]
MNDLNNLICREIKIDVTNICNLSCPLCPDTGRRTAKQQDPELMSFNKFKKFVDGIKVFPEQISFGSKHEPLINKSIFQMIDYINTKQKCLQTTILTNLNLLNSVSDLINSKVKNILIGLDGIDQESYSKYRVGGNFDVVINNIKLIQKYKKNNNLEYPKISIIFVVFRHNEHLIEQAKSFFNQLDVDITFRRTDIYNGFEDWLPINFDNADVKEKSKLCCDEPFKTVNINVFGDVYPCCAEEIIKFPIGNIFNESFEKIWNGKKMIDIRNFLLNKVQKKDIACLLCPIYKNNGYTDV